MGKVATKASTGVNNHGTIHSESYNDSIYIATKLLVHFLGTEFAIKGFINDTNTS